MKLCSHCKKEKTLENFGKKTSQKDGFHYYCKDCRSEESKKRHILKAEELNKKAKEYYAKNLEKSKTARKEYYFSKYKEKALENAKKWKKTHIGEVNFVTQTRRANQKQRTPLWADKKQIKNIYTLCAKITQKSGIIHHVDHIVPLQGKLVSGLHWEQNLQIITATENYFKNNRWDS